MYMDKKYIKDLQKRAQKLLQVSSDDQHQQKVSSQKFYPEQKDQIDPQLFNKCLKLTNQNTQLKYMLKKEKEKNKLLAQQISILKKSKDQSLKVKQNEIKHLKQEEKLQYEKYFLTKLQEQKHHLQQQKIKVAKLQQLLDSQKSKCYKLNQFIRRQIPKLQQNIVILTTKIQTNLSDHLTRDIDYY